MAFEVRQQLKLNQQLHMTPLLKQAISLLLFSRQELVEAVQRELLENPFLEEKEAESPAIEPAQEISKPEQNETPWTQEEANQNVEWEEYLGEFSSQSKLAQREFESVEEDGNPLEACHSAVPDLEAHLMAQLLLSPLSDRQKARCHTHGA